jgi:hypothetical protein
VVISQKYELIHFSLRSAQRRGTLLKRRWGSEIMKIKIGDKIRYIATSEDGEVQERGRAKC